MIEKPLHKKSGVFLFISIFLWIFSVVLILVPTQILAAGNNELLLVNQQAPTTSSTNPLIIVGVIFGSIILISLAGLIIISKLNSKKVADVYYRDRKRKHDIERIRYSLSAFAKTYGRYPDAKKAEYTELLEQLSPLPIDPMANQDTGFSHQVYNYYYDNQSLNAQEKGRDNTNYYRLWCHLENKADPEVNPLYSKSYKNIYLKTSIDPLNPVLLNEPQMDDDFSQPISNTETMQFTPENHRKESLTRFLLLLVGTGLIFSAVINGVFYFLISKK